jgi:arginine exporter protein ArgO
MQPKSLNTAMRLVWLRTQWLRLWHWFVLHDCVMPALILMNCAILGLHIWLSRHSATDIIKYWDGAVYGGSITYLGMVWGRMREHRRAEQRADAQRANVLKQMETHVQSVLNEMLNEQRDDEWKKSDID